MGIPKIKSATTLRNELYETLKEVSDGEPQVITHKQGDPVLLVSKEYYDRVMDEMNSLKKMTIGLSQIESAQGIDHKSALKQIEKMKAKWK